MAAGVAAAYGLPASPLALLAVKSSTQPQTTSSSPSSTLIQPPESGFSPP
jgi:hypothetical protein